MDINGTKFHLLADRDDWGQCLIEVDGVPEPLSQVWRTSQARRIDQTLEWDADRAVLHLARKAPLFRQSRRTAPLDVGERRGAGRDQYGNWYWIDAQQGGIRFLPDGAHDSVLWWDGVVRAAVCTPAAVDDFAACQPVVPPRLQLCGLAVTTRHYLVVGSLTDHGLLVFDLHGGGAPLVVRWPDTMAFCPWDVAATPDGGVLVLDRENLMYWRLDEHFRVLADAAPDRESVFQPTRRDAPRNHERGGVEPHGYALALSSPLEAFNPISIEPGPDGHVLILDTVPQRGYSIVYEYCGAEQLGCFPLELVVEMVDPREGVPRLFSIVGHDVVFVPGCEDAMGGCQAVGVQASGRDGARSNGMLYVAEFDGNQVFAFEVKRAGGRIVELEDKRDFLPLRRWGGKGLVGYGNDVFYDFVDRWVPLRVFVECYFAGLAVLTTPIDFRADLPGGPFDSGEPGCVWHRLLLDAVIPGGGAIGIRARAADDPALLPRMQWQAQPMPYLRSGGAEIPFYDAWPDRRGADPTDRERTGTWELLFQGITGRYVQLELTISGTGRSTPELRALRAWFPRFSYLDHYLPAIFREDVDSTSFLDRWLANFEGFYTVLEEQIEHVGALFDPRTAPPDALAWLGCWLGLVLDPLVSEQQRRFLIRYADRLYRQRGTLPGVEIAVRAYLEAEPDVSLFDLRGLGRGGVRIVEQFRTRGIGGLAYGDPNDRGKRELRPLTRADVAANAHRFAVLVPHDLTLDQLAMVERIVALEKPAHTAFELKRYWDMFRVGEARLGLDTKLGYGGRFVPFEVGKDYLPDGYLEPRYPFNIDDRMVSDRDRMGGLPAL